MEKSLSDRITDIETALDELNTLSVKLVLVYKKINDRLDKLENFSLEDLIKTKYYHN